MSLFSVTYKHGWYVHNPNAAKVAWFLPGPNDRSMLKQTRDFSSLHIHVNPAKGRI